MGREGEGIAKEILTAEDLARYPGFNRNWIYRQAEAAELLVHPNSAFSRTLCILGTLGEATVMH
jgi:hypothetical protein